MELRARGIFRRALGGVRVTGHSAQERGFAVLHRQAGLVWSIECDGEPHPVELRADLLVQRDGRRYVAEVKEGAFPAEEHCF